MTRPAIEVDRVSKRYALADEPYGTLRSAIASLARRKAAGAADGEVWALRDVSAVVGEGESVGVVGRNGSGKTTLLRVLARITEPTSGVARTRGRVGALLEVGTGFHPELTGRENVFLNGAILGMRRADVRRRFDDIVAFAGVERFVNMPLKRYSSGMQLRLAFAVAAHFDPEIVVVDEVLAVGDAEFQQRCLGRMSEFSTEGRTVLFVSHDLGAVGRLCPRSIWLDAGAVRADGVTAETLREYLAAAVPEEAERRFASRPGSPVSLSRVAVSGERGDRHLRRDERLVVDVDVSLPERLPGLDVALVVFNERGVRVLDDAWSDTREAADAIVGAGRYRVSASIPPVLPAGDYLVAVWIGRGSEEYVYEEAVRFRLWPGIDEPAQSTRRNRLAQPHVGWTARPLAVGAVQSEPAGNG